MSLLRKIIPGIIFLLCVLGLNASGASVLVTNKPELETALSTGQPGDTIILKDQAWIGINMKLTFRGTEEQPIVFRSETPGGASLEGSSRMEIGGDYIIVDGFRFINGYNIASAIVFKSGGRDANYCRLTNCLIDRWNPPDPATRFHWVVVSGSYNRIDHCHFSNKLHSGVTVMVKAGADQPGHHRIDHNYFGPKPKGDGNGYESLKMGGGDDSMFPLHTLVEKNFFYRCDGEVELISNKSWENIYRHNTFYESQGTLTLRWGRKCLVEGNYFIGNGRSNTGGIRITDQDHIIVNNYFENLRGTDARAAISVMSGIPDTEGGNGGHGQTKNARIIHNTIINCKESLNLGYWDDDDLGDPRGELTAPENCTIANNIIISSFAPLVKEDWAPSINTTWLTNIGFGASLGIDLDTGFIEVDPKLVLSTDGIMRITMGSPAINTASHLSDTVLTDFEMQLREDGKPDIGADELSDGPREKFPVQAEDVGPDWYIPPQLGVQHQPAATLTIYPNPASDRFYISREESMRNKALNVEVFDLSGRQVLEKKFLDVRENYEIVTGNLEGLYLVRVRCGTKIYHSRILLVE